MGALGTSEASGVTGYLGYPVFIRFGERGKEEG